MTRDDGSLLAQARSQIEAVNRLAGDDPVRIGILTPLTGPGDATAGSLVVRGACLGARYIRERGGVDGGRQIAFSLENDQASAAEEGMQRSAVGGLAKLALADEVVAALGQWHLRTTSAVAHAAERLRLPIFIENGHRTVTAERLSTVFRTYYSVGDRSRLMVDFMATHGMTKVAILAADTVFGLSTADALEEFGAAAGLEFLRFDFDQEDTTDLRPQLTKVRDFQPDMLINDGVVRTNYLIANQAVEVGLRPAVPMMVTFGFPLRSADYWRLAGPEGNGVIWPGTYYRPSWPGMTDVGTWFTRAYREQWGSFPVDTSMSAFTDVTIIARALETATSAGPEGLIASLEAQEFDTWRGPVAFTRDGEHWHHDVPGICLMQYHRFGQDFDEAAVIYPDAGKTGEYRAQDELG